MSDEHKTEFQKTEENDNVDDDIESDIDATRKGIQKQIDADLPRTMVKIKLEEDQQQVMRRILL